MLNEGGSLYGGVQRVDCGDRKLARGQLGRKGEVTCTSEDGGKNRPLKGVVFNVEGRDGQGKYE